MEAKTTGQPSKLTVNEKKSPTILYCFLPKGKVAFLNSRTLVAIKVNGKFTNASLVSGTHEMERIKWDEAIKSSTYQSLIAEGMLELVADSDQLLEKYKNKPISQADIKAIETWVKKTFEVQLLKRWLLWIDYQRDARWELVSGGINSRIKSIEAGTARLIEPSDDWGVFEDDEAPWVSEADAGGLAVDWSET